MEATLEVVPGLLDVGERSASHDREEGSAVDSSPKTSSRLPRGGSATSSTSARDQRLAGVVLRLGQLSNGAWLFGRRAGGAAFGATKSAMALARPAAGAMVGRVRAMDPRALGLLALFVVGILAVSAGVVWLGGSSARKAPIAEAAESAPARASGPVAALPPPVESPDSLELSETVTKLYELLAEDKIQQVEDTIGALRFEYDLRSRTVWRSTASKRPSRSSKWKERLARSRGR